MNLISIGIDVLLFAVGAYLGHVYGSSALASYKADLAKAQADLAALNATAKNAAAAVKSV